ncbi:carbohydrate ABC transporter permease [Celerinatantimonas yamalensis]|uniref:Carbohydrate ABC transporter permease n=1 Tax=Celerinatantimonas yamalensis TaxID=559956 RepID=A0ABW9G7Z7_9GAMM
MKTIARRLGQLVGIYSAVSLLLVFCLFPFAQIVSTSLKHPIDWGNPSLIPKVIHWDAYEELLGLKTKVPTKLPQSIQQLLDNPALSKVQRQQLRQQFSRDKDIFPFGRYMLNSLLLALLTSTLSTAFAASAAYALARLRFVGRSMIANSVLFVYMIGGVLLMVPLYQMSVAVGLTHTLTGTLLSILLIYLVQTLPVAMYMLGNYFRTISVALEEAAMIDGCSRFEAFRVIILPLSKPMLFTVFVYCFVIAWNEYLFASVFLRQYQDFQTIPLALQSLFTSKNAIWGRIMAASVLTLIPVIICFMLASRHLSRGLTDGGVKE